MQPGFPTLTLDLLFLKLPKYILLFSFNKKNALKRMLYPLIQSYISSYSMSIYRKEVDIESYTFSKVFPGLAGCFVRYVICF